MSDISITGNNNSIKVIKSYLSLCNFNGISGGGGSNTNNGSESNISLTGNKNSIKVIENKKAIFNLNGDTFSGAFEKIYSLAVKTINNPLYSNYLNLAIGLMVLNNQIFKL